MGKTKYKNAFDRGMVVGARGHRFVSRTAMLLGFSCSTVSVYIKNVPSPKDIQPT
jgi:hypothetical protein